jgi:small subunit ribosomal protein S5
VVKATIDALNKLRSPMVVAKERGISMNKLFEG